MTFILPVTAEATDPFGLMVGDMAFPYLNMDTQSSFAVSMHSLMTIFFACLLMVGRYCSLGEYVLYANNMPMFKAIFVGSRRQNSNEDKQNHRAIEKAPFQIPFVGHVWAFIWDIDRFLRYCRFVELLGEQVRQKANST